MNSFVETKKEKMVRKYKVYEKIRIHKYDTEVEMSDFITSFFFGFKAKSEK
jgi:hypothetical protein